MFRARGRAALLAAAWALCGCAQQPPGEAGGAASPPNVILVSIDTLRADRLGAYGYERDTSPFLDSLAARGVRFDSAFAPSSWTVPSHMSLLTGLHPQTHQVETQKRSLPASIPTLAEILRGAGYETTAFVTSIYMGAKFGFGRGFDRFDELLPPLEVDDQPSVPAGVVVDRALDWARGTPRRPYFLLLHLFDPHLNYEPPLEYARMFDPDAASVESGSYAHVRRHVPTLPDFEGPIPAAELEHVKALYDGEIRYTDDQLRRLFEALREDGLLENTMIVVTSDHGEEFNEHGSMEGHQWTLYDEVLRVPLTIVFPAGQFSGASVDRVVQLTDVAPTILKAVGLEPPPECEGRDLRPLLAGDKPVGWEEVAFGHIRRMNLKWSVRTPRYKLIFTGDTGVNRFGVPVRAGYELYDLERDPGERNNIYDPASAISAELDERLAAFTAARLQPHEVPEPQLSEEELERLRSLGYVD